MSVFTLFKSSEHFPEIPSAAIVCSAGWFYRVSNENRLNGCAPWRLRNYKNMGTFYPPSNILNLAIILLYPECYRKIAKKSVWAMVSEKRCLVDTSEKERELVDFD